MCRSVSPLLCLLPALAPTTSPAHAGNDYYFGDSDLEQGNHQIVAGLRLEQRAPYSCANGLCRDSNGPVWAERLSPGVVPVLAAKPPYRSLNFAVSGAHMTERGDSDLPIPTGVTRQVARFGALQDSGAIRVTAQDRFFIHAGTNDLMRVVEGDDPGIVQSEVVAATADHVKTLAARGARWIVVAQVQAGSASPRSGWKPVRRAATGGSGFRRKHECPPRRDAVRAEADAAGGREAGAGGPAGLLRRPAKALRRVRLLHVRDGLP